MARIFFRMVLILLVFFVPSSFSYQRIDYRDGMKNNLCKELKDNILVYFVFVDTKETSPWTEFDIRTTLDSIDVAMRWIESQARKHNQPLTIITDYYIGTEYTTVKRNLPNGTVKATLEGSGFRNGLEELNKWADAIAARIGKDVQINTKDGIPEIQNPKNKERLAAHLRDDNKVESVALVFMVNNYFRNDISLTVNHLNTLDVEFAIASYKYPSIIAQNVLNLFGAADLYKTVYRRNENKIKLAAEYFPNDIMQDVYAVNINKLEIDAYTRYLLGWSTQLEAKFEPLLTDKIANF
ncbi:MAG: hypothetical protein IPM71_02160 [Bacteroidota bacterium]|nr:MAG: hypothetical protein IPM71_02160 [Bacteroidota bacterium]